MHLSCSGGSDLSCTQALGYILRSEAIWSDLQCWHTAVYFLLAVRESVQLVLFSKGGYAFSI